MHFPNVLRKAAQKHTPPPSPSNGTQRDDQLDDPVPAEALAAVR